MFVATAYAQAVDPAAPDATETLSEVAHDNPQGGFPPFETSTYPSQLLWLAITFGLFYLFLQRVVLPRLGGIIEVRRDRIAQDLDQAAMLKQEADAAIAAYEQSLADARKKAGQIGQKARDEAKADADAERKAVEAELDAKLSGAEARIAEIKSAAMKDIDAIAESTAAEIVEALIGQKADKAEIAAAVRSESV